MANKKMNNGCAYEKVTRNMVENLNREFADFRTEIKLEFVSLKKYNQELYNHLSSRLPPWATAIGAIGIAILTTVIGILIGRSM